MENRNYTITIKADNLSSGNKSPIAGDNKGTDKEKSNGGLLSKEGAKAFGKAMVAYSTVKSFATQVINHEVSMVQLRTGSNELQQRANFTNQMIQKGVGILEGGIAGAMVGGLPGFIVGTGLSLLHTMISYGQKQQELDTQRTVENQSIQMNYVRAGASGSRK